MLADTWQRGEKTGSWHSVLEAKIWKFMRLKKVQLPEQGCFSFRSWITDDLDLALGFYGINSDRGTEIFHTKKSFSSGKLRYGDFCLPQGAWLRALIQLVFNDWVIKLYCLTHKVKLSCITAAAPFTTLDILRIHTFIITLHPQKTEQKWIQSFLSLCLTWHDRALALAEERTLQSGLLGTFRIDWWTKCASV